MIIGQNIKIYRKLNNLTQRALASKLHYSASYICDIETGRTIPTIKTLQIFADEFKVDLIDLVGSMCCYEKITYESKTKHDDLKKCKECILYKTYINKIL